MTDWYVTVDRFCAYRDDPDASVWTVSRDPNDIGWETDSGCPGYGLIKNDAEELANAANNYRRILSENLELKELIQSICDYTGMTVSTTWIRFDPQIEGK
jgi:hypothetical protein